MASPFKAFRKNQKILMAIATIIAMIAFIFPWNMGGESGPQQKNPDVFTWKYGKVTLADIQYQLGVRQAVNAYLRAVAEQVDTPQSRMMAQNLPQPTPDSVIATTLYAKKAEELGLVPTDTVVNRFLEDWTERKLSSEALAQILQNVSVGRNHRLTQQELFETLRTDIQAYYGRLALDRPVSQRRQQRFFQFAGDTPADRWEYYCQLKRKATAQIYPVAVADFVSEIPDPSADDLRDFYEQHKNQLANPKSPTPGFMQPYKAQFQYFKADYVKLLAEETPKVTDAEVAEDYEKNKDRDFRKKQLPEYSAPDEKGAGAETPGPDTSAPADKDTKSGEPATPSTEPMPEAKSETKTEAKAETKSDAVESKPSDDAKKSEGDSKPDEKSSSSKADSSLNGETLALADDLLLAQNDAKSDEKSTEKSGTSDESKKDESKKSGDAAASPETKTPDTQKPDTQTPAAPVATIPPIEYEPLENVREQIKKRIADQKVTDRVQTAFKGLLERMEKYRSELGRFKAKIGPEPKPLDFKALADEFGVEAKETSMITALQAYEDTDIGRSSAMISYSSISFPQMAFGNRSVSVFEPRETFDNEQNSYLWWKIADEASKTPKLDEIKDEVVRTWKMIEARKPAKAKAEEIAERVRKADQPMRDLLTGLEVATAGPFSWLDGPLGQMPQLSQVSGVKDPGNDFMKTVFSLGVGEVGVAPNYPQNTFYVVQVEGVEPPRDVLENGFMSAMSNPALAQTYALVAALDHDRDQADWFREMQAHFEFQRAPDADLLQNPEEE